jgi:hypothetical protein
MSACGISAGTANKAIRDWTNRGHQYWESLTGLKGIPKRALRQKNQGTAKTKQKPLMMGDETS